MAGYSEVDYPFSRYLQNVPVFRLVGGGIDLQDYRRLLKILVPFGLFDPVIGPVTNKIASAFVTRIIFPLDDPDFTIGDEDQKRQEVAKKYTEKYKEIFKKLKIRSLLIQFGLYYEITGSVYPMMTPPVQRKLICQGCGKEKNIQDARGEKTDKPKYYYDYKRMQYRTYCPVCKRETWHSFKDIPVKDISKINVYYWDPAYLNEVRVDDFTGKRVLRFDIPPLWNVTVKKGDPHPLLESIPYLFLNAIKKHKKVDLYEGQYIKQYISPTIGPLKDYGLANIARAIDPAYILQILRVADMAIAKEYIIPKRFMFPTMAGSADPIRVFKLSAWKEAMGNIIKGWKQDPTAIALSPMPIQVGMVGVEGKSLFLPAEKDAMSRQIVSAMGQPPEILMSGAGFSQSLMIMREIENFGLTYKEMLDEFLNDFIIDNIANFFSWPKIKVKLADIKMSDDVQRKMMLQTEAQNTNISNKRYLKEAYGVDYDKEQKQILKELDEKFEVAIKTAKLQAAQQAAAQLYTPIITADIINKERDALSSINKQTKKSVVNMQELLNNVMPVLGGQQQQEAGGEEQSGGSNIEEVSQQALQELMSVPPDQRKEYIQQLQEQQPEVMQAVMALAEQNGIDLENGEAMSQEEGQDEEVSPEMAQGMLEELAKMPPDQQAQYLQQLQQENPEGLDQIVSVLIEQINSMDEQGKQAAMQQIQSQIPPLFDLLQQYLQQTEEQPQEGQGDEIQQIVSQLVNMPPQQQLNALVELYNKDQALFEQVVNFMIENGLISQEMVQALNSMLQGQNFQGDMGEVETPLQGDRQEPTGEMQIPNDGNINPRSY